MILTYSEKIKRVEIAYDLLKYASMMTAMHNTPKKLIKNIYRDMVKVNTVTSYSEETFKQIKRHHYFATVTAAFSFVQDEFIEKLKLKHAESNITEDIIKKIFINPDDVELYRNPLDNNRIKVVEILKHIRDALNHHENGILYKYIEEEDAIEIDLKDLGIAHNGKTKTLHVKVPIKLLMSIIHTIATNEFKQTKFINLNGHINYNAKDLKEELKRNIKILRLIPVKGNFDKELFEGLYTMSTGDIESAVYQWEQDGKIKIREYTYENGSITDFQIDSICEQIEQSQSSNHDWRTNRMYNSIAFVNALKLGMDVQEDAKEHIASYLCFKNVIPLGIVSFDRFDASAIFNNWCLETWNSSYVRILEQKMSGITDLRDLTNLEWFILDPVEKIYTEYENFIRYAIVNFAPIGKDNKSLFVNYNGKNYNCTFMRNAFTHGRVGIVRKSGQYYFALYDTQNGIGNEVKYYKDEDFKPKMYTLNELVEFAQSLCMNEIKKIEYETPKAIKELNKMKIELLSGMSKSAITTVQDKKKS